MAFDVYLVNSYWLISSKYYFAHREPAC